MWIRFGKLGLAQKKRRIFKNYKLAHLSISGGKKPNSNHNNNNNHQKKKTKPKHQQPKNPGKEGLHLWRRSGTIHISEEAYVLLVKIILSNTGSQLSNLPYSRGRNKPSKSMSFSVESCCALHDKWETPGLESKHDLSHYKPLVFFFTQSIFISSALISVGQKNKASLKDPII